MYTVEFLLLAVHKKWEALILELSKRKPHTEPLVNQTVIAACDLDAQ